MLEQKQHGKWSPGVRLTHVFECSYVYFTRLGSPPRLGAWQWVLATNTAILHLHGRINNVQFGIGFTLKRSDLIKPQPPDNIRAACIILQMLPLSGWGNWFHGWSLCTHLNMRIVYLETCRCPTAHNSLIVAGKYFRLLPETVEPFTEADVCLAGAVFSASQQHFWSMLTPHSLSLKQGRCPYSKNTVWKII